ncbi:sensor domain-containing diguanylate cyclase [Bacillus spongiae]|uniref:Sensor domain-containing diguanylate cyclase n=1 Tax=Bacillus spongiae TaxID=2683610 RepID=A0ABU8H8C4_9BACI
MVIRGIEVLQKYKSELFDLINEFEYKEYKNTDWLTKWTLIIQEVFNMKGVTFYLRKEKIFKEMRPLHSNKEKTVTLQEVMELFPDDSLINTENLDKYSQFSSFSQVILLRSMTNEPIALLCFKERWEAIGEINLSNFVAEFCHSSSGLMNKLLTITEIIEEEERYRELFKVTETFHSSMEVDTLLDEIITTLHKVFPSYSSKLLLSNDHQHYADVRIQNFNFDTATSAAMESFVNGVIQVESNLNSGNTVFYAPLRGKQGIYGVMQVSSQHEKLFQKKEIEFIKLLAYTAGSALENAKLYQQSKQLISDLQLINETSHRLNLNLRLSETLAFLNTQIQKSFKTSDIGFVFLKDSKERFKILPGSSDLFRTGNGIEYIHLVEARMSKGNDPLFIGDLKGKYGQSNLVFRSIMAVPMVQHSEMIGFCLVLHQEPYFFSYDMFKLLQSFIHHSTLALTNSMLREKLEEMVITDYLTQLYSRYHLDEFIERSIREDTRGVLLLIDIDDFKHVNDTYGHHIGDKVLIQVAKLLKETVTGKGLGARWGGEEMAVYFPQSRINDVIQIAQDIVEEASRKTQPPITVSCGLAGWDCGHPVSSMNLFMQADEALYEAKREGKNQVIIRG